MQRARMLCIFHTQYGDCNHQDWNATALDIVYSKDVALASG